MSVTSCVEQVEVGGRGSETKERIEKYVKKKRIETEKEKIKERKQERKKSFAV